MPKIDAITVNGTTYDIADNTSGYITGMTILSYGNSLWADAETAYLNNRVVYCRASTNTNPATGSQTRMAFLAYVNNETTPTEFEFQYYRSVSPHSDSQQGDQVFVYKLNKTNGWSVTTREAYTKIAGNTGISGTYSNGTLTLSNVFDNLSSKDLNTIKYQFDGYSTSSTNYPSGTNADGALVCAFNTDGTRGLQIYSPHGSTNNYLWARRYFASAWQSWEQYFPAYMAGDTIELVGSTCAAYIYSSSQTLIAFVPVSRPNKATNATIKNLTLSLRNASGAVGSTGVAIVTNGTAASGYTASATVRSNGISISITKSAGWGVTNNTMATAYFGALDLTLS